jgi:hypothetical protein
MEADAAARWEEAERLNAAGRYQHARPLYAGLGSERMYAPLAHLRLSVLDQRAGDLRGATAQGLAAMSAAYGDPELLELLCKTLCRSARPARRSPAPRRSRACQRRCRRWRKWAN